MRSQDVTKKIQFYLLFLKIMMAPATNPKPNISKIIPIAVNHAHACNSTITIPKRRAKAAPTNIKTIPILEPLSSFFPLVIKSCRILKRYF